MYYSSPLELMFYLLCLFVAYKVVLFVAVFFLELIKEIVARVLVEEMEKKNVQSKKKPVHLIDNQRKTAAPEVVTKVLTPFSEKIDWSQYDAPAFLRKGKVVGIF